MDEIEKYLNEYEEYEEMFNPLRTDRAARRRRRPKPHHQAKKSSRQVVDEIAETVGIEGGFQTTYQPSRYEAGWLLQSLRSFYDQELITDVTAIIKGGKEASVYRCAASPDTGEEWLAVKVYRPRMFRNLRNDKVYRQGRPALDGNGRAVNPRDVRLQKAIGKKTTLGEQVTHTSWLMYEYTTLELLHEAGAAVPRPFAAAQNAILMSYVGDAYLPAPTLNEVQLAPAEALPLFRTVMRNVALMLHYGRIHGDLSAYNILYWDGQLTLIDFPQVVNSHVNNDTDHPLFSQVNPDAYDILRRDITRVCDYFSRQGVEHDPQALTDQLWQRFAAPDPDDAQADISWLFVEGETTRAAAHHEE